MKKAIAVTFVAVHFIIAVLLLFSAGSAYYIKRELMFPNVVYFAAGIILTAILCFIALKLRRVISPALTEHIDIIVLVTILVFFVLSLFICIGGFFYSDWDPSAILYGVYGVLRGHPEDTGATYFSNHPNNLLLVYIYLTVLRFTSIFAVDSVGALVAFQCLLSSVAAFVFFRILEDMTEDLFTAYIGLLVFEIWIVLSPWFIITYSDEVGIIIPLLILMIYQRINSGRCGTVRLFIYCGILSALVTAGYYIKPQTAICFIAISVLYVFDNKAGSIKELVTFFLSCTVFILAFSLLIKAVIIPSMGIKTDSSRSFGMAHYFMMGLNEETDGVYSDEDTLYTDSFATPEEKRQADMELAGERLKNYGFRGLIGHTRRKILVNYNDGLFAWGVDGKFFAGRENEDFDTMVPNAVTAFVWRFIMPDGTDHGKYSSAMQTIWLTILTLDLLCGILALRFLIRRKKGVMPDDKISACFIDNEIYAVMLTLTGLFLFELLFEAKARYLIIYTPYFLFTAVCGARALMFGVADRMKGSALKESDDPAGNE